MMKKFLAGMAMLALATAGFAQSDSTNYSAAQRVQGTGSPGRGDPVNVRMVTCTAGVCTASGAGAAAGDTSLTQANPGSDAAKANAVQGVTGGKPIPVTGTFFQTTQPVSGTVAVSNFPAIQPISTATTLPTSSPLAVVGASFTRPADVLPYAVGDIVGPATGANCGGTVATTTNACALFFQASRLTTGSGLGSTGTIIGARFSKSGTAIASYRLHIYRAAPTSTVGDNDPYTGTVNVVGAVQLCTIDITTDDVGSDGAKGTASPARGVCGFTTAANGYLFVIVESRSAYTPTSASTHTVALEVYQD
jgi:hypothetical protein